MQWCWQKHNRNVCLFQNLFELLGGKFATSQAWGFAQFVSFLGTTVSPLILCTLCTLYTLCVVRACLGQHQLPLDTELGRATCVCVCVSRGAPLRGAHVWMSQPRLKNTRGRERGESTEHRGAKQRGHTLRRFARRGRSKNHQSLQHAVTFRLY